MPSSLIQRHAFLFALCLIFQIWLAHAFAFFTHEYAHAVVAWVLGWKRNPFVLHVPAPSVILFLSQWGINQDVDEAPIFGSGHGIDAALIAAAGMIVGNGFISLPIGRLIYRQAIAHARPGLALLGFWITAASVGNFLSYVPLRTFIQGGDMGSVQRGFGWSPWIVVVLFGMPTALMLVWFVLRIMPETARRLFPSSRARQVVLATLAGFFVFGFYGYAGFLEGGPWGATMSTVSLYGLFPISVLAAIGLLRRRTAQRRIRI
ncbi:hypothetical protein [Neoasaia chiangmaiensis]|uniref:hypothetical protein n=1 Tax=Neoasaia chiangmaiensis TaxID=320497 RepID=UPI001478AD6A|nr:hypothetical protein [Neoasaia chiangmaiensis]